MRYGTLSDGVLTYAPNPLHVEGFYIHNPADEQYAAAGYLPIIDTPYPEPVEGEEKYYVSSWEEQEGQIVRVWTETDPPAPVPVMPTLEDRVNEHDQIINALLGGAV